MTRRTVVGLALGVAALLIAACGGASTPAGRTQPPAPDPTPTFEEPAQPAEDVLRAWAHDRLSQAFLGDCSLAARPGDVGKQCATFIAQRGNVVAYGLGPTFSEPTRLFLLQAANGEWAIIHEDTARLETIPWPLEVGAAVVVAVDSDCLQVREQPGLAAVAVDCLADGTTVTISAGPTFRDGFQWWRLRNLGWAAGDWLRYRTE